jgi:cobalamin synthase
MSHDPTGIYQGVTSLAKAVSLMAALFGTPPLFDATKVHAFAFFAKTWGHKVAGVLYWVLGAAQAYLIYATVSFLVSSLLIWAMTALAARKFGGQP